MVTNQVLVVLAAEDEVPDLTVPELRTLMSELVSTSPAIAGQVTLESVGRVEGDEGAPQLRAVLRCTGNFPVLVDDITRLLLSRRRVTVPAATLHVSGISIQPIPVTLGAVPTLNRVMTAISTMGTSASVGRRAKGTPVRSVHVVIGEGFSPHRDHIINLVRTSILSQLDFLPLRCVLLTMTHGLICYIPGEFDVLGFILKAARGSFAISVTGSTPPEVILTIGGPGSGAVDEHPHLRASGSGSTGHHLPHHGPAGLPAGDEHAVRRRARAPPQVHAGTSTSIIHHAGPDPAAGEERVVVRMIVDHTLRSTIGEERGLEGAVRAILQGISDLSVISKPGCVLEYRLGTQTSGSLVAEMGFRCEEWLWVVYIQDPLQSHLGVEEFTDMIPPGDVVRNGPAQLTIYRPLASIPPIDLNAPLDPEPAHHLYDVTIDAHFHTHWQTFVSHHGHAHGPVERH